jgi:hypothetical protein
MSAVGDIVEIPYQEGDCVRCGWIVTRNGGEGPWHGQLGGDCRQDPDGVHYVVASMWKTRRARVAEATMTSVMLMDGSKVVRQQEFPADGNWTEHWNEPLMITDMHIAHHKYRYHAAVDDE